MAALALTHAGRSGALGHADERAPAVVAKELGPAVLVEEEILVAVVVEVAPHGAHRHAGAGTIDVRETHRRRDVGERAVAVVAIETVEAAFAAVGDVEVLPAVAVEVGDGHRRAHRRDLRHDVLELRVERRRLVNEVDATPLGGLLQAEPVPRERISSGRPDRGRRRVERFSATTATSDATNTIVHTTQSTRWRAC